MKKIVALLLVIAMCLAFGACGGGSKLDVKNAVAETIHHIYDDALRNQARAMENTYLFKCVVGSVTNEYFCSGNLRIYLESKELAELNTQETVSVVGKVTEVIEEKGGLGNITYWVVIGDAQLYDGEVPEVEPREHEILTGLLKGKNKKYENTWYIELDDNSNVLKNITFAEGEDLSAFNENYNSGEEIKVYVEGLTRYVSLPDELKNAKIVK